MAVKEWSGGRWIVAAVAAGLVVWLGLRPMLLSQSAREVRTERLPLSPQECNTECQSQQTDCILNCDGAVVCEHGCVDAGLACAARCHRAPDAGAPPH